MTDEWGRRNVPGLANVGRFTRLTWADRRQTSLAKQVSVPVFGTHPVEMGMQGLTEEIPRRLERDPCYAQMFVAAFPRGAKPITFAKVAAALASFERTLISRDTPFDHGLLAQDARAGYALFREHCAACHSGPDFTDMAYHRLGAVDQAAPDEGCSKSRTDCMIGNAFARRRCAMWPLRRPIGMMVPRRPFRLR
ncbi:di-heme cytochrome c peroxidase [Novosphingobium sp. GV055]|nr:di-heme cytochrome c peroxidase [Novosphingobium sp. GV055]PUB00116.1 di-heme cytochrome c peroxidase [Novosphingobium sp. GV061]PUB15086.1 di-heme cytochrome c peroxidase [Novosphingobium sp. GV079]PUB39145.1 di-heme cytochrome c peroxidase [Novosphingobium sp. GV027]